MRLFFITLFVAFAGFATAQGTGVTLGGFGYDSALPVEITADSLDVNQSDGSATFQGNVVIGQGEMRLSAGKVVVIYGEGADGRTEIKRLIADGGVTFVSPAEAAEAELHGLCLHAAATHPIYAVIGELRDAQPHVVGFIQTIDVSAEEIGILNPWHQT